MITRRCGDNGFTMVEIVVTLAILGILVMLAVASFNDLREKYAVENETRELYAHLMDARGRSSQRSRFHFFRINTDGLGYVTYADTNPPPDGNRQYDNQDNQVVSVSVKHQIDASHLASTGTGDNVFFDTRGIATGTGYIKLSVAPGYSIRPDYDCITIRETRLRTGQMNATDNNCIEK